MAGKLQSTAIALLFLITVPILTLETESSEILKSNSAEGLVDKIWNDARPVLSECHFNLSDEVSATTAALVAIEMNRRNGLERIAESLIVRGSARFGSDPPDLSIGIAQVRPATIRRANPSMLFGPKQAVRLLDEPCYALSIARSVVEFETKICEAMDDSDDRLGCVGRRYNGQTQINSNNLAYLLMLSKIVARAS